MADAWAFRRFRPMRSRDEVDATAVAPELMTLEQYAAHRDTDERYVTDLVRGVLVREPRPGDLHGMMQVELGRLLGNWAREAHGARVTAESGYVLDGKMTLLIDGQPPKTLKVGDSYQVPAGAIHDGKSGDKGVKVIATYVVEKGKPLATPAM